MKKYPTAEEARLQSHSQMLSQIAGILMGEAQPNETTLAAVQRVLAERNLYKATLELQNAIGHEASTVLLSQIAEAQNKALQIQP